MLQQYNKMRPDSQTNLETSLHWEFTCADTHAHKFYGKAKWLCTTTVITSDSQHGVGGKSSAEKIFLLLPHIHRHFQPNPCLPALCHKVAPIKCQTDCKTEINMVSMWSSHIPVKIHSVPECVNTLSWFAWLETRIHTDESLSHYLRSCKWKCNIYVVVFFQFYPLFSCLTAKCTV